MTVHSATSVAAPSSVGLVDAAALLGAHPETVRLKAKAGELPGRKVGKRWMFSTIALERYLAGQWIPRVVQGDQAKEGEPCRSSNAKVATTGITSCTPRAAGLRYKEALAPSTKGWRRSCTTA
ncbi:helix-turn-helix domain-containing protein [Cupriavidus campinensis]